MKLRYGWQLKIIWIRSTPSIFILYIDYQIHAYIKRIYMLMVCTQWTTGIRVCLKVRSNFWKKEKRRTKKTVKKVSVSCSLLLFPGHVMSKTIIKRMRSLHGRDLLTFPTYLISTIATKMLEGILQIQLSRNYKSISW